MATQVNIKNTGFSFCKMPPPSPYTPVDYQNTPSCNDLLLLVFVYSLFLLESLGQVVNNNTIGDLLFLP